MMNPKFLKLLRALVSPRVGLAA
ncbi:MAG: hypothetical protein RLZZ15_4049, partial [Verrucomicrobiota bacterium]